MKAIRSAGQILAVTLFAMALAPAERAQAASGQASPSSDAPQRPAALPDGWRGDHVKEPVLDSSMFVVEAGDTDAPTILLVHGLGQNGYRDWLTVIHGLAPDYHVVALDLPGFGWSSRGNGRLSPDNYADVIAWLLETRGLEDVHLVGHSMGATVALRTAAKHPGYFRNLVLVDAAGILHRAAFVKAMAQPSVALDALPAGIQRTASRVLDFTDSLVEEVNFWPDVTKPVRQNEMIWQHLTGERPNTNAAFALIYTDFSSSLDKIALPTTVIWGEHDPVTPVRTGHLLHGLLPNSRLELIDGAGHVPMRTHSEPFLRAFRRALVSPPTDRETVAVADDTTSRDYTCRGNTGQTLRGRYGRIVLDDCVNVSMENVVADSVIIRKSLVDMTHVEVRSEDGAAMTVVDSVVRMTDVTVEGDPAMDLDYARLDIAGSRFISADTAFPVERRVKAIFSVSRLRSGEYTGYLHGAAELRYGSLDGTSSLHSNAAAPP